MNLLFFGELYPDVVHGVSIANRLNLSLLSSSGSADVTVVQEKSAVSSIGRGSFTKVWGILKSVLSVFSKSRVGNYQALYMVFSLSQFGIVKTLLAIYCFRKVKGAQIICHLHRGDFVEFYQTSRTIRYLVRLCFRRVDRIIVLSHEQKEEMSKFFHGTISVVENTVLEESEIVEANLYPERKGFIYISNYYKAKGIYDLIEAFKSVTDSFVQCYGTFDGNEKELERVAPASVVVNGPIDSHHKFQALSQAEALILPSWNEGQPTVILEAMLVSTPVITTKVGLIGDMLGDDYPFYFQPKDPGSLVRCVQRFVELSKTERAALGKELNARYWSRFSQQNHKKQLFEAFQIRSRSDSVGEC